MIKLSKYIALNDAIVVPAGVTTTYRVVSEGTGPGEPADERKPLPSGLQRWLRRQHPADVVRIVLMLIAVGLVIVTTVRFG